MNTIMVSPSAYPVPPPYPPKSNMVMYVGIGIVVLVICCVVAYFVMKKKEVEVKVPVTPLCGSGTSLNKRTNTCVTTPASSTLVIGDYCFETNSMCLTGNCYSVTGNCGVGVTTSSIVESVTASIGTESVQGNMMLDSMLSNPSVPCAMSLVLWGLKSGYKSTDMDTNVNLRSNIMNFFTGSSLLTTIAPKAGTTVDPAYANVAQMACAPVKACISKIVPWMKSIGYTTEVNTIMNFKGPLADFPSPFPNDKRSEFRAALASRTLESVKQKDGTAQTPAQIAMAIALNTSCKDIIVTSMT